MTPERIIDILIALIAAGAGTALIGLRRAKSQNRVDDAQSWSVLVSTLERRIVSSDEENRAVQQENLELLGYAEKLKRQIREAGLEPADFRHRSHTREKDAPHAPTV